MHMRNLFVRRARRDERGAILLMAVPGVVLAMVATALSVDIGRQVFEKRSDQAVADAASLDASRNPANAQALAEASARRNGFDPTAPGNLLVATRGTIDATRTFTADPAGTAVEVAVTSNLDYIFMPGDKTLTARAVAQMAGGKEAGFGIGTSLASVDTSKSALLNAVLGSMIGGTADVVGWQGLVNSHVTLDALRGELEALDAGVQFGTVDQLLSSDITMAELAQATANVLSNKGDSNATLFAGPLGIIAQSTNTSTFTLGEMIKVAQGSEGAALAGSFNVFSLLTGAAQVANGTNAVNVPNIGIAIPNVGTTSLKLEVVENQKTYFGPDVTVNTNVPHATTGQVKLTLTPTLNAPLSVLGLAGVTLTGALPLTLTASGADANLTSITCPSPNGGERVSVDIKPLTTSVGGPLTVTASVLTYPVTFNVSTVGTAPTLDPTAVAVDFVHPTEFYPTAAAKRVGAAPIGLGGVVTFNTTASVSTPPVVPLLVQAVVNATLATATPLVATAVTSTLGPLMTSLDTLVVKPLLDTLGVSIGAADVMALNGDKLVSSCGTPKHPVLVN